MTNPSSFGARRLSVPSRGRTEGRICVLEGTNGLHALRPAWEQLLATIPHATIFSTWEFLSAWCHAFGRSADLVTLAVLDANDRLVGLAPLCTHKQGMAGALGLQFVRFLGDGSGDSENLDIIVAPGREPLVIAKLLDYLQEQASRWSIVQFNSISSKSPTPAHLVTELQRRNWQFEWHEHPGTVLDFGDGWDGYLRSLSPRERRRVRGYLRQVGEAKSFTVRRCDAGPELFAELADFFDLHQRRWQSKGERGSFGCAERRQFYQELSCLLAPRGALDFWLLLEPGGRPVAGEFDLRYRDTVYSLQAGFDPAYAVHHPGYVLRACVLRELVNAGIRRYDFLAGSDSYKQHWAGHVRTYQDIHFAIPGTRGSTYLRAAATARAAKTWLRPQVPPALWAAARRFAREHRFGLLFGF